MKHIRHISLGLLTLTLFITGTASATTLRCINDRRAVDGGLTYFSLRVGTDGKATALIHERANSKAVNHVETTKVRALNCTFTSKEALAFKCTGVSPIEGDLVATHEGTYMVQKLRIKSAYKKQNYLFSDRAPRRGPNRSGCVKKD